MRRAPERDGDAGERKVARARGSRAGGADGAVARGGARAVARAVPLILDDVDTLLAENARLRAAEAEGERLRALAAEARDMLRAMPWRRGGDALVARLDRAALGEP